MKIYLASSWRNTNQPPTVVWLRRIGHEVYDFRNLPDGAGFGWEETQADKLDSGSPDAFLRALKHPVAEAGFASDFEAMEWAEAFVLLLPCGRSAHLEAGWAIGQGKPTAILTGRGEDWELMYKMADLVSFQTSEVEEWLSDLDSAKTP